MSDSLLHPTPERLEALVEDTLPEADRAVVESHLTACGRCRAEVAEWRALFAALQDLPALEPSYGFTDRVMARVQIHQSAWSRALALLGRLVPQSTFGWVLVAALTSLPVVTLGGAAGWLLTRTGVDIHALWIWGSQRLLARADAGMAWLGEKLLATDAAVLVSEAVGKLAAADPGQLGGIVAALATLTVVSTWILYTNLIRPFTRERSYASYGF